MTASASRRRPRQGDTVDASQHRRFRSEQAFQREVIRLAKLRGWVVWHDTDSRRNAAGFPDLLLIRERVLWRELKAENGKVRGPQLLFMMGLLAAGQDAKVWRPSDMDEVERVLR